MKKISIINYFLFNKNINKCKIIINLFTINKQPIKGPTTLCYKKYKNIWFGFEDEDSYLL